MDQPDNADGRQQISPVLSWDLLLSPDEGATLVPLPDPPGEDVMGQEPMVPMTTVAPTDSTDTSTPSPSATIGTTSSAVPVTSSAATDSLSSSATASSSIESTSSVASLSASPTSSDIGTIMPSTSPTTTMDSVSDPPLSHASLVTLVTLGTVAVFIAAFWVMTIFCRARRRRAHEDELAAAEDSNFYPFGPEFGVYRARSPRTLSGGQDSDASSFSVSRPPNLAVPRSSTFDVPRPILGKRLTDGPYPTSAPLPPGVMFGSPPTDDRLGDLKVTNLASCDVSVNSDSRSTSRVGPSSEQSTPRQGDGAPASPARASPRDHDLRSPWPNDPITSPSIYVTRDSPPIDEDTHAGDGWGNSLRATVANALTSLQSANPFMRPSQVQMQESFTAAPQRKVTISSFGSVHRARALDRARSIRHLDDGWITHRIEPARPAPERFQLDDPFADQLPTPQPVYLKTPVITTHAGRFQRPAAQHGRSSSIYSQSTFDTTQLR